MLSASLNKTFQAFNSVSDWGFSTVIHTTLTVSKLLKTYTPHSTMDLNQFFCQKNKKIKISQKMQALITMATGSTDHCRLSVGSIQHAWYLCVLFVDVFCSRVKQSKANSWSMFCSCWVGNVSDRPRRAGPSIPLFVVAAGRKQVENR